MSRTQKVWKSGFTVDRRREMIVAALELVIVVTKMVMPGVLCVHDHKPINGV
jgi:hypothetical protein